MLSISVFSNRKVIIYFLMWCFIFQDVVIVSGIMKVVSIIKRIEILLMFILYCRFKSYLCFLINCILVLFGLNLVRMNSEIRKVIVVVIKVIYLVLCCVVVLFLCRKMSRMVVVVSGMKVIMERRLFISGIFWRRLFRL